MFIPPIPRYVFGGCCSDTSHSTNIHEKDHSASMVSAHSRLRSTLKHELIKKRENGIWVLDVLGSLTQKSGLEAQVQQLKLLTDKDNVHLNLEGYTAIADGIVDACKKLGKKTDTAASIVSVPGRTSWRGFETYPGIGRSASSSITSRSHWVKPYQPVAFGRRRR